MISIKGLDKAKVLKALYDHSHIQGYGFLQAVPDGYVTVEHCRELLSKHTYFDYLYGKVLKVDLSDDEFDERLYDRDCGLGMARRAINTLRKDCGWSVMVDTVNTGLIIRPDDMAPTITIRGRNRESLDKLIWILTKVRKDLDAGYEGFRVEGDSK